LAPRVDREVAIEVQGIVPRCLGGEKARINGSPVKPGKKETGAFGN